MSLRQRIALALALACSAPFARGDEQTLQNDKFGNGTGSLDFGAGLVMGEAVGESFIAPAGYFPFTIKRVQFITAGTMSNGVGTFTIKIYEDKGGIAPGKELASFPSAPAGMKLDGNTSFVQETPLPSPLTISAGGVRVALFADQDTNPGGLTVPFDHTAPATAASTVCSMAALGTPCDWLTFKSVGGKGTWVVRLIVDTLGAAAVDMAVGGTGPVDMAAFGTVSGAPLVDSISPTVVLSTMSDTAAVILGKNFAPAATVFFSGPKGPVTITNVLVTNSVSIQISTPARLAAGLYDIVVKNPDGTSGILPKSFTVTTGGGCACDLGRGTGVPVPLLAFLSVFLLLPVAARRARRRRPTRK